MNHSVNYKKWKVSYQVPKQYTDGCSDGVSYTLPIREASQNGTTEQTAIDLVSEGSSSIRSTNESHDDSDDDPDRPEHSSLPSDYVSDVDSNTDDDASEVDSDVDSNADDEVSNAGSDGQLRSYINEPTQPGTHVIENEIRYTTPWSLLPNGRFLDFVISAAYDALITYQESLNAPETRLYIRAAYERTWEILDDTTRFEELYISGPSNARVQHIFQSIVGATSTPTHTRELPVPTSARELHDDIFSALLEFYRSARASICVELVTRPHGF